MNASHKVVVYTGNRCAYCNAAKRLLDSKGIKYKEIDGSFDPSVRQEMLSKTEGRTFPQILIGDNAIGGCDELYMLDQSGKLDSLLAA